MKVKEENGLDSGSSGFSLSSDRAQLFGNKEKVLVSWDRSQAKGVRALAEL